MGKLRTVKLKNNLIVTIVPQDRISEVLTDEDIDMDRRISEAVRSVIIEKEKQNEKE